jgi:hypothetical protein
VDEEVWNAEVECQPRFCVGFSVDSLEVQLNLNSDILQ